ncbi:MAG: hypothetical protein D6780_06120, partial [Candidatus Dadabacteria bacterium]
ENRRVLRVIKKGIRDIPLGKRAAFVNNFIRKLRVEFAHCIFLGPPEAAVDKCEGNCLALAEYMFSPKMLKDIDSALRKFGKAWALLHPRLRAVYFYPFEIDAHADYSEGLIAIDIKEKRLSNPLFPKREIVYLMLHELGHALNLGWYMAADVKTFEDIVRKSWKYLPFADFLELSGWMIFQKESKNPQKSESKYTFKLEHRGYRITLKMPATDRSKGKNIIVKNRFPNGGSFRIDGTTYQIRYDENQGICCAHRLNASFSRHHYAFTSPWEDFSEAFAEYCLEPEALADLAPEKFIYFQLFLNIHSERLFKKAIDKLKEKIKEEQS